MKVTRKRLIISTIIVFANVLLPGKLCLGSKDQFSAEKINAQITAKAAIAKTQEKAKSRLIDPNYLSQKMSNRPAEYQDMGKTWIALQQEEKNEDLLKWYTKEVDLILQGLNREKPEGVEDFFTKEEREAFLECPKQVVDAYLSKNFGKNSNDQTSVFSKARKRACDLQLAKLIKDVYPTESEVDTAVSQGKMSDLRSQILERLIKKQKEPVFSENVSTLSTDFIDPVISDAKKQFEEQGSIVARSYGASYVMPEDIGSFIKDEIAKYQENLKKEKQGRTIANKVYTTFPSVQKKAVDRANEIAIKRFRDAISEMSFPISKNVLEKLMNVSLIAYSDKNKSWESCLRSFRDNIVNQAVEAHAAKAPEAKRSDFRKFLISLISNSDQSCKDAMSELISKSLKQGFEEARKEISQEQFKEFFEPLEKEIWKPSKQEIDSRYNRPSISSSAVSEPLKMPGISLKSFDPASLLEETIEIVRQAEESAIKRGLDALKDQMDTVEKLEFQMKNQIKDMNDLTIDKAAEIYTEKVKSVWSSSRFAKDYTDLFTRTQDEIKRRAKDMLDLEIVRQRQVAVDKTRIDKEKDRSETLGAGDGKQQGRGGGESKGGLGGGGKGPAKEQEELGDKMPDVILDFSYEGGKVYADIMFIKQSKDKLRLLISPDVNLKSSSMSFATDLFTVWLKNVSERAKNDQKEINVYVLVRVFNGSSVLYSMVYYFRECLVLALEKVGDKRIKIHWYDKLFDEPDDVEKYRGKPVLPPTFDKNLMPRLV